MALEGGSISKALLVVKASAATPSFVQALRFQLYEAGFIVVREEFRMANLELANKLVQNGIDPDGDISNLTGNLYLVVVACAEAADATSAFLNRSADLYGNVFGARTKPHLGGRAVTVVFPKMVCDNIPTSVEAREYVQEHLKGLLLSALTELAKQKPKNPIEWLANYLLENNPQSPPVTLA